MRTESARIVIVGGGIVGCSTAYHLAKMGETDVLLLERNQLTSGSTWHAAGLVGQLRTSANITQLLGYSVQLYDAEQGTRLGTISDEQLQQLTDSLEEESLTAQDYYLTADTIDMLESDGADPQLVALLRNALGEREGMDIRWTNE